MKSPMKATEQRLTGHGFACVVIPSGAAGACIEAANAVKRR
ncbi:MAG: hypothetical protein OXC25_02820 [Thiotrichales bacterium]|nr:hypothetical protein [Thiotrichales bacterium]